MEKLLTATLGSGAMHPMSYSHTDFAYAAGLFDGEGTVTLGLSSNPNAFRRVEVSLSSTDLCLCEIFKNIVGYGHVYNKSSRKFDHWAQAYEYRISGNGAQEVLKLLLPYMRCPKKIQRARHILENFNKVTKRNGRYNEDEVAAKIGFETAFFDL